MNAVAVVVNYNGGEDLPRCLAALRAQTVDVRVVLVDCASTDGSASWATDPPEGVTGLALEKNVGFTGGCAAGLDACGDAEIVGFFNPDCFAAPDLFQRCREAMTADSTVGGVAPRLERPDGVHLDSCGQVLTPWLLRVRDRGYGERSDGRYTRPATVLAACGAGMVYRRAALEAVAVDGAVFPREYFAFWEDLDLGWRASNAGWRIAYEPSACAVHRRAGTAEEGTGRLIFRRSAELAACILLNRWATLARNLHAVDFAVRLPLLLLADVMMVLVVTARRPAVLRPLLRGASRVRVALRQRRGLPQRPLRELV